MVAIWRSVILANSGEEFVYGLPYVQSRQHWLYLPELVSSCVHELTYAPKSGGVQ